MSAPVLRLAAPDEAKRVVDFVNANFDWRLPLINREEYFNFYYKNGNSLQFALAEEEGVLVAATGYIRASDAPNADVWVSVWVAAKGHNGVGLELMAALPRLTGAQVVACNNIRPKTMAFYRFLGWHADRVGHFYRLAGLPEYRLARVADPTVLPAGGDLSLEPVEGPEALAALGMPQSPHTPRKDVWYMQRRYFAFPHLTYQVYAAKEQGRLLAYLACRVVDSGQGKALRIAAECGVSVADTVFAEEVALQLTAQPQQAGQLESALRELTRGKGRLALLESGFLPVDLPADWLK